MTLSLSELSEKANFIAGQQRVLRSHWNHYGNSLIQGITLSKASLHLNVASNTDNGLGFWLFDHFLIRVTPEQAFNGHVFNYTVEARDDQQSVLIGRARLSDDGMLDGSIHIDQREAVLSHFLNKISGVYAALYQATERGESLTLATLAEHQAAV
ncbi:MAG: transcriptional regulator [Leclercia sp.]